MLMKHNFRITAKGYSILICLLLSFIFIAGLTVRSALPGNQLIYALNKEFDKDEAAYNIVLDFQTQGDAVLYKDKHLIVNNTLSLDTDKIYLEGYLNSKLMIIPSYKMYFSDKSLYVKTPLTQSYKVIDYDELTTLETSNPFSMTRFFELLNLADPELQELMYSNLFDIKNIFEDNIQIEDDQIIFSITLEEGLKKFDEVLLLLCSQDEFRNQVKTRYSNLYDEFGQHPFLENFNLNSRVLFNKMVELDNNFYETIKKTTEPVKEKLNPFKDNSTVDVIFTFDQQTIKQLKIIGMFNYKNFDANERLTLTIEPTTYQNNTLPNGEMSSLKPYVKKIYETLKTEFN